MSGFAVVRKARAFRRCDSCRGPILAGERYRNFSLPPDDREVGNVGWWHLDECAACAERYGRPVAPLPAEARR